MFNKKTFIGILVIVLTMMLIVGCSEIAPKQALENQQATAHIPDQAQAELPFGEGESILPCADDFIVTDYCSGKILNIGSTLTTNCGTPGVKIQNISDYILFCRVVWPDGSASNPYIYSGSYTISHTNNKYTLGSVEYLTYEQAQTLVDEIYVGIEVNHGWILYFVE